MDNPNELQTAEIVKNRIYEIRGHKVMLDSDLAELYGVATKALNQAVKRNSDRFPDDFMFQLTINEWDSLRSQIVTSSKRGGRAYLPFVFTEHGILMLSSVLASKKAIKMNIQIVRVFSKMRKLLLEHADLKQEIIGIKEKLNQQDKNIKLVFSCLDGLTAKKALPRKRIGFMPDEI